MKNNILRLWQAVIGFTMVMVYVTYKYGTHWVLFPVVSHKYGMVNGSVTLALTTVVGSYLQLRAYRKAQGVIHTTRWLHDIKSGRFEAGANNDKDLTKWWFKFRLMWICHYHGYAVLLGTASQLDPFVATFVTVDTESLKWRPSIVFFWAFIISISYSLMLYTIFHGLIFG